MDRHRTLKESNQTFSFARFMLLLNKHWMENRKLYLLGLLALAGLSVTWFSFILLMTKFHGVPPFMQFLTYYLGLYFIGCLFANSTFAGLGNKAGGIEYLSVPASHLEKLLCGILFSVFLFFIAFTVAYYIVDIPIVRLSNRLFALQHPVWPGTKIMIGDNVLMNVFTGQGEPPPFKDNIGLLYGFFATQSAFVLGSVYFRRYSFIKTIVAVLILFLLGMFLIENVIESSLPGGGWRLDGILEWVQYSSPGVPSIVRLPVWIERILVLLMEYSAPFIFWWATYYRLKEKEV